MTKEEILELTEKILTSKHVNDSEMRMTILIDIKKGCFDVLIKDGKSGDHSSNFASVSSQQVKSEDFINEIKAKEEKLIRERKQKINMLEEELKRLKGEENENN